MTCGWCDKPLAGRQTRWCSKRCKQYGWNAIANNGVGKGHGGITSEAIMRAKQRYPSCAGDWDAGMVEQAWPRLCELLLRRLQRLAR